MIGAKTGGAITLDNALGIGPGYGIKIPAPWGHISKGMLRVRRRGSLKPMEYRNQHDPCHGGIGREYAGGQAFKQAGGQHIIYTLMIPLPDIQIAVCRAGAIMLKPRFDPMVGGDRDFAFERGEARGEIRAAGEAVGVAGELGVEARVDRVLALGRLGRGRRGGERQRGGGEKNPGQSPRGVEPCVIRHLPSQG